MSQTVRILRYSENFLVLEKPYDMVINSNDPQKVKILNLFRLILIIDLKINSKVYKRKSGGFFQTWRTQNSATNSISCTVSILLPAELCVWR